MRGYGIPDFLVTAIFDYEQLFINLNMDKASFFIMYNAVLYQVVYEYGCQVGVHVHDGDNTVVALVHAHRQLEERSTLIRTGAFSPGSSNHAPGNGDSPRMWLCTSRAGRDQSIRVSALLIFSA